MEAVLQDWLSLALRWAHIVAAISWIGSSFYFMWLDSSLQRAPGMPAGVKGENWTVHGGGFYHTRKFMVAPEGMPAQLHWFRWESYATWLSGFFLLATIYYWQASRYLIDAAVLALAPWQAILLSAGSLVVGWFAYDRLCRSALGHRPVLLFAVLYALLVAATWGYGELFSARAAFLHVGALIATWMSGNVFLVIIPNQRVVVADLQAGRTPSAEYGRIAKLRSTHNNYLTLPVIFLMISNHYPMTFGHPYAPLLVLGVLVLGAVVRDWFNRHEAGATGRAVLWQWPAAGVLLAGLIAFTAWRPDAPSATAEVSDADALALVATHCAACHAEAPRHPDFAEAPGGIALETLASVRQHAPAIMAQAVLSDAMPLGNETGMTPEDRARLGAWLEAAR